MNLNFDFLNFIFPKQPKSKRSQSVGTLPTKSAILARSSDKNASTGSLT